nr:MAG TPA: hypothetical protein [Bacteriophage sp.]
MLIEGGADRKVAPPGQCRVGPLLAWSSDLADGRQV